MWPLWMDGQSARLKAIESNKRSLNRHEPAERRNIIIKYMRIEHQE
jgi:hypothetical protein